MFQLTLPFYDFFKAHDSFPDLFTKDDYWFDIFLIFLGLVMLFAIIMLIHTVIYSLIDKKKSTIERKTGELIDKRYNGEQTLHGSGVAVLPSTNGGISVGMGSTSSHQDEEFLFFLKSDKVYKCEVDMQQFYKYKIGDQIGFDVTIGGLTKEELKIKIVE